MEQQKVIDNIKQAETKEMILERFINGYPSTPTISEEDIMNEVRAVRSIQKHKNSEISRV